jgi:hypothetical protein
MSPEVAQIGSHGYPPRRPLSKEHLPLLATKLGDRVWPMAALAATQ